MIKVYFETPDHGYAELIAVFKNESLYMTCLKALETTAEELNMVITESMENECIKLWENELNIQKDNT